MKFSVCIALPLLALLAQGMDRSGRPFIHGSARLTDNLTEAAEPVRPERPAKVMDEIRRPAPARDRAADAPEAGSGSAQGQAGDQPARGVRFDPVVRDLEGWKVHVEPALLDGGQREQGAQALAMLANHLQRIKILVPAAPLARMQRLEIWIEHSHPALQSMQYHPSRQWLIANGHDPRLAQKVHIPRAGDLLSREQMLKHPAVILHELAHAYHDLVLGFDHPEIIAAYEQARAAGRYESVLAHTGKRERHYGLTNHKEYFAEGTEAFFYRNDFYPFVRAELLEHDPILHGLLVKVWEGPEESKLDERRGAKAACRLVPPGG